MARPQTIANETILSAAREEFLARGFATATTATIAKRAGISEGTIFKRFRDKLDLFLRAMDLPAADLVAGIPTLLGTDPPAVALPRVMNAAITFASEMLPKMLALASLKHLIPWPLPANAPPFAALRMLSGYFAEQKRRGQLRDVDPEIAARLVMGAVWVYAMFSLLTGGRVPDKDTYVRAAADILARGLAPEGSPPPKRRKKKTVRPSKPRRHP